MASKGIVIREERMNLTLSIWVLTGETSGPAYRVVLAAWGVAMIAIGVRDRRHA